uniref:Uncharacterized protein n=1 Tax=Caenorhabditis japonica TaxID=281687 RepID=A0A8R1DK57_CAEJA
MLAKLFLSFTLFNLVFSSTPLDLRFVCDSYRECIDEKSQLDKMCGEEKKVDQKCVNWMKTDFETIQKYENIIKLESSQCIDSTLKESNQTHITSRDKNHFCAAYLFNRTSTDGDCSIRIARLANRCDALRRCCEPAVRCEQTAVYSENGRTLSGLREEVDIKMAECAHHEEELKPRAVPAAAAAAAAAAVANNNNKKQKKIRIIKSPPFSLCLKYLQCQKDAHTMRTNCSKLSNPHSIDALDSEDVFDSTWTECREPLLEDFTMMNKRRDEAFAYLDKCVPVANVTREFLITDRVCRASALKERKPRKGENCHLEVARKRNECGLLRDCCVQADVCERSALYAVISDEYLLRRTQLRETLDTCMSREINEENLLQ